MLRAPIIAALLLGGPALANAQLAQPKDPVTTDAIPGAPGDGIPALSTVTADLGSSPQDIEALVQALRQALPMTPEMIAAFRKLVDESQQAAAYPPNGPPTGKLDAVAVDLSPGGPPPQISVGAGTASVVSFFDASGAAWPVTGYVIGDPKKFQVLAIGDQVSFLTVTPLVQYGYSNLVVRLQDLDSPIVIDIRTDPAVVNYRRDIRIAAYGPNAAPDASLARLGPVAGDLTLMTFLTGAELPSGAKPVVLDGASAQAWLLDGALYLRSSDALLSPAWNAALAGPGDIRVYRLSPSPILLMSIQGRPTAVRAVLP